MAPGVGAAWPRGGGCVSRYECFVGGGLVRVWRLRRERTMDEQRKTAGIVLAVEDERAGNVSSHGERRLGVATTPGAKNERRAPRGWSREKIF